MDISFWVLKPRTYVRNACFCYGRKETDTESPECRAGNVEENGVINESWLERVIRLDPRKEKPRKDNPTLQKTTSLKRGAKGQEVQSMVPLQMVHWALGMQGRISGLRIKQLGTQMGNTTYFS